MYPSLVLKALYRIFSGFATKSGCHDTRLLRLKKLGGIRKVSTCPDCKETAIMSAFHHYGIYKA